MGACCQSISKNSKTQPIRRVMRTTMTQTAFVQESVLEKKKSKNSKTAKNQDKLNREKDEEEEVIVKKGEKVEEDDENEEEPQKFENSEKGGEGVKRFQKRGKRRQGTILKSPIAAKGSVIIVSSPQKSQRMGNIGSRSNYNKSPNSPMKIRKRHEIMKFLADQRSNKGKRKHFETCL